MSYQVSSVGSFTKAAAASRFQPVLQLVHFTSLTLSTLFFDELTDSADSTWFVSFCY
jgi:hypothetical protein